MDPVSARASELAQKITLKRYSRYLDSSRALPGGEGDLDTLMNVILNKKLKIIPKDLQWGGQSDSVFEALSGDFMKPRINEVDELLAKGVNVTIYNGQICAAVGVQEFDCCKHCNSGLANYTAYNYCDETRSDADCITFLSVYWPSQQHYSMFLILLTTNGQFP